MLTISPLSMTLPVPSPEPFVLLVDDHEPTLSKLREVVQAAGYECVTASSASEALVLCDKRRPTLVVTDLSMPMLDGQGLARWLRARFPAVPILLLTGEVLDAETECDFRRTFAAVLTKPLQVESFLTIVDGIMPRPYRGPYP